MNKGRHKGPYELPLCLNKDRTYNVLVDVLNDCSFAGQKSHTTMKW